MLHSNSFLLDEFIKKYSVFCESMNQYKNAFQDSFITYVKKLLDLLRALQISLYLSSSPESQLLVLSHPTLQNAPASSAAENWHHKQKPGILQDLRVSYSVLPFDVGYAVMQ